MTTTAISTLEIIIDQKALLEALSMLSAAISKRSTMPVLSNVKIESNERGVTLSATNLEVYCKIDVPATVESCGAITVSYKELLALVKPLKKASITLLSQQGKLSISCNRMQTELSTIGADQFPCEPQSLNVDLVDDKIILPIATFRQMVNAVAPSATPEYYGRVVMTGMSMKLHKDNLTFACADSHRAHIFHEKIEGAGSWRNDWIFPAKILFDLIKKFPKSGDITLSIKSLSFVSFPTLTCGNITAYVKTIGGCYPDYEAIIPNKENLNISLSTSASSLLNALDIVALTATENSNIIHLCLNGSLEIKAKRHAMDNPMSVQVEATTRGKETELLYNYVYLQDVLKICPVSNVHLACESALKASVVTLSELPGFMAVIMPMYPNL